MSKFNIGDVVENEFLTPGEDRDWELGVVIELVEDRCKVARIGRDKEGYYWTNQWEIRSADRLRKAHVSLADTGLEL
jgi:hypothetical protein